MNKLEAQYITKHLKKIIHDNYAESFLWECKFVRGEKYYFKSDKSLEKELRNLQIKNFVYKFSDLGMLGTPCDGVKLYDIKGYFFFKFMDSGLYQIEDKDLQKYIDSGAVFLNEENANLIGIKICALTKN